MKASIKGNILTIEIEMDKDRKPSASGKSIVVASTRGNKVSELQVDGKHLVIAVNAYTSTK